MANCIKQTPDGGFIVAGTSNSNNGDISGNHGQNDYCLIKLNAAGNLVWQHSYGGTGIDEASSVIPTSDGGYMVAGKSASHNGDVTGNHGSSDYWLVKTDDQGTLQWQKSYGGSLAEIAYFMEPTSDNGFVIVGTSSSNNGDVSGNHGMSDAWIIKVDQNGNLIWQKSVGGSQLDIANDIKLTNDGGFFVTGYSLSNDGDIPSNKGQEDFLFFKLDADGNLQWIKTMGGSGSDDGSAGIQTIDGGYAICGLTHSRDLDVAGNHGAHDLWVVKTNSAGVAQWTRCLGGSDGDDGIEIKQQSDGTILASGYTGSTDGDVTGLHGLHDIWLVALDTSGNLLWQKTLGGTNDEFPRSLQIISTGEYIIAGRSNSSDGDLTVNHGNFDFWVVKLTPACNTVYYADADGDGYGNLNSTTNACSQPSGYVTGSTDCNDGNASIHPGASEVCNGLDDNCNSSADEGLTFVTYFTDADDDTYGSSSDPGTSMCSNPGNGYSTTNNDCDDSKTAVHPGASEICYNLIDDDCNGQIDDNCTIYIYYTDLDGDTYGDPNNSISTSGSTPPSGYVVDNTDCNDGNPDIHPAKNEVCNELDDNCNGSIDEGVKTTFYADADGDSYGNILVTTQACSGSIPVGYVSDQTDCDDALATVHPNATEACNGIDDNCNSQIDEVCDVDQDGYSIVQGDCNDSNPAIYPGAIEACNGIDDNCDATTDEGCDNDGDGYNVSQGDCDDNPATGGTINPGALEACNGVDDNCNGQIDEGVKTTFYADADSDGYGNVSVTSQACSAPSGYVSDQTDCNDASSTVHPYATETCNGVDDNCNSQIDEGAVTATITPSGSVVICSGSTLTLYANTGSGLTYQWKKNGSNISGATSSLYNTKIAAAYSVRVSSGSCSATSAATTISVSALPAATITPLGTVSVCPGVSLTMNANTGSGLTYQWQKSSVNISGATGSSYATTVTGQYKVIVTNSAGCSKISSITTLNNYAAASVKITNTGSLNICSTGSVLLSAKVVSGYTYQWFKNNASIGGATGTSYTATQSGTYNYQATTSNGCTAISTNKVVTSCRLENESNGSFLLSVYPNPTNGNFNIELHLENALNGGSAQVELINIVGDVVLAEDAEVYEGELLHTIKLKDKLPDGLYFVKIIVDDQVFFQRIIFQN